MPKIDDLLRLLKADMIEYKENELLAKHTTFEIGGPARIFCIPKTNGEISAAIQFALRCNVPVYLLGKGSNILFTDDGYAGMIIYMGQALSKIIVEGNCIIAKAGAELLDVCRAAQKAKLTGLEFAYGIPGNIGGAVYMNAGAYGGEMKDVLSEICYLTENGSIEYMNVRDAELGYRTSLFQYKPWCILSATICLQKGNADLIKKKMHEYMGRRQDKQPLEYPSAGSAFKRPPGTFAGALIDECGLRGFQIGGAAISQKHCGFIVNMGGATCQDVLSLADHVSKVVKEKTGFVLEKEIRVVFPTDTFLKN